MKLLKIVSVLLLSGIWFYALHSSFSVGGTFLPPIGKFTNPYIGFWKNVRDVDKNLRNLHFQKTGHQGKIFFTDRLIPRIVADNLQDAYFMQGYIHAFFRLWQMDFSTRAAEGRISEIVGIAALDFDKTKRRKGLAESAKISAEVWKKFPESNQLIEAYSAGVNYYIDHTPYKDLPFEYKLLNYKPERWSPYRCALFHKNMAEVLCGRDKDIELTNAKIFFGKEFPVLFPEMDSLTDPVIPAKEDWGFNNDSILDANRLYESKEERSQGYIEWNRPKMESGIGSNNWAIGPSKSKSKNPILCNDPHLNLTLPSIWFEQQIITPQCNVYGVTFPGLPAVVIGFNKDIAWGVTNAGWDVLDWYQVEWKNAEKQFYTYNGEWVKADHRMEKIYVKNHEPVWDTVLLTKWGPIVFTNEKHAKKGLAMRWIIQDSSESSELDVFRKLNESKSYENYREAISEYPYPAQNFAFASKNGDIALTVQGKMPIKKDQQGRFVFQDISMNRAWQGYISSSVNPHVLNPARGFISSANQRSTDLSFPNYFNDGDFRDYRGRIINQYLTQKSDWTREDCMKLQLNNYSLKAETALPYFLSQLDSIRHDLPNATTVIDMLKSWNFTYEADSKPPVYFDKWFEFFYTLCWDEIFTDSTKTFVATPSDQTTISLMKKNKNAVYFDIIKSSEVENSSDIINISFDSLLHFLRIGDHSTMNWASFKDASISHMARIPALSISDLHASGTQDVINAHAKTFGPSWRMVVELTGEGPKAFGIYPGGQSGHPGSKYYSNMIEDWLHGNYQILNYVESTNELIASSSFTFEFKR